MDQQENKYMKRFRYAFLIYLLATIGLVVCYYIDNVSSWPTLVGSYICAIVGIVALSDMKFVPKIKKD